MGVTKRSRLLFYILFRIILVVSIVAAITHRKYVNLFLSIFLLVLVSLPDFKGEKFVADAPGGFEVSIVIFIYLSLFLGNILFFVENLWWLEHALRFILAIIVVMIGFFLVYIINRSKQATMNLKPSFIAFFALTFALSGGLMWEIIKFLITLFFGIQILNPSTEIIMINLAVYSFGAMFASIVGYIMMKYFGQSFATTLIAKFARKYPFLISSIARPRDFVNQLIKGGESEKIEFKSTVRTNIYTNEHDRRVEHSLLKTIVAFLNSTGGTLLVGVSDEGEVIGLEIDKFKNQDKIKLHLVMLIKKHISNSHNAPISFDIIDFDGKIVMRIRCGKSSKQAFLNYSGEEEFFIRAGPSSIKLTGSRLVDYVRSRFKKR